MRLRGGNRTDEALARCADQQRQPEQGKLVQPGQRRDALLGGLAKPDTGVEQDIAR